MKNPGSFELGSLESRSEYKRAILDRLLGTVLIKKFGERALDEHSEESLSAVVAGAESPDANSKQIEDLIRELESSKNVDQLVLVARANGVELTQDEITAARLEGPLEGHL